MTAKLTAKSFNYRRSHHCGDLRLENSDQSVHLCGWVHRYRDHGGIIFIDLRDKSGITQLVFDPQDKPSTHQLAESLRQEWVIYAKGKVRPRGQGLSNPKLQTGEIEVLVEELNILSKSATPPFEIDDEVQHSNEELRLRYRYLDIRTAPIHHRLAIRDHICRVIRRCLCEETFTEVHTPYLAKSTPEGARDYLVPSRVHPGKFYALPQSPQLFKQLLMIGGMDRYYQICPCFRDEDLRADRQPEFYQLDLEMSFGHPEDIFQLIERMFSLLFQEVMQREIPTSFRRISYQESIERYGTDKPDLRFGMPLVRIDSTILASDFTLAKEILEQGGSAKAICVKGGAQLSRKNIDDATKVVQQFGLGGLAWIKYSEQSTTGTVSRFFNEELQSELFSICEIEDGDLLLIGFAQEHQLNQAMDHLRRYLANKLGLVDPNKYEFCWVTDFPLFENDPQSGRILAMHHAFTSPKVEDIDQLEENPLKVRAESYDLVLNGYELGSGSQRIHDSQLQKKIFEIMELSAEDIDERFGFFVNALQYGTPPHLGIALGLDRIVMLLTQTSNIRDVIAFPKTQSATDLMTDAPSTVELKQLHELHIRTQQLN